MLLVISHTNHVCLRYAGNHWVLNHSLIFIKSVIKINSKNEHANDRKILLF